MSRDKIVNLSKHRCTFCGKPAELLCDKVVGTIRTIDLEGPGVVIDEIKTCDRLICKECATHIGGADYCPACVRELKEALKGR